MYDHGHDKQPAYDLSLYADYRHCQRNGRGRERSPRGYAGGDRWVWDLPADDGGTLDAEMAAPAPGAGGLLFLPYLLGERSPYWNPPARGTFVGLTMNHGKADLARATLEGVALHLRLILDAVQEQGGPSDRTACRE